MVGRLGTQFIGAGPDGKNRISAIRLNRHGGIRLPIGGRDLQAKRWLFDCLVGFLIENPATDIALFEEDLPFRWIGTEVRRVDELVKSGRIDKA